MKQNHLTDLDAVSNLLQWIKSSRISSLSLIEGELQLSMHNQIEITETAIPDAVSTSTVEVRAPAAGRFRASVSPGAELGFDTVIGTVQLVHSRRPVFSGAAGYLVSFQTEMEAAVAYGDVVAIIRLKDEP